MKYLEVLSQVQLHIINSVINCIKRHIGINFAIERKCSIRADRLKAPRGLSKSTPCTSCYFQACFLHLLLTYIEFAIFQCVPHEKVPFLSRVHCQQAGQDNTAGLGRFFYMLLWRIIIKTMLTGLVVHIFMSARCWTRYSMHQEGAMAFSRFL